MAYGPLTQGPRWETLLRRETTMCFVSREFEASETASNKLTEFQGFIKIGENKTKQDSQPIAAPRLYIKLLSIKLAQPHAAWLGYKERSGEKGGIK